MIALFALVLMTDSLDVSEKHVEIYAGLQIADAVTTLYLIELGGVELNPVMRPLVAYPVPFVLIKAGMYFVAKRAPKKDIKIANGLLLLLTINNIYQISRALGNQ